MTVDAAAATDVRSSDDIAQEQQKQEATHTTSKNDSSTEAQSNGTATAPTASDNVLSPNAQKQPPDSDAGTPTRTTSGTTNSNTDDHTRTFSRAQVRIKEQQARLEAKIAADAQVLALRKHIVELEHNVQALERSNKQALARQHELQHNLDTIVAAHKRTLHGMNNNNDDSNNNNNTFASVVASLAAEQATRNALEAAYATQTAELLAARARIAALSTHVRTYQTTETVLAQSVSHLQHRFDHKDQQRAATLARATLERTDAFASALDAMRDERDAALQAAAHATNELAVSKQQLARCADDAHVAQSLHVQIETLETENAVLVRKAEQLQRADAQLRARVKDRDERIAKEQQQTAQLRVEIAELTTIASDLMEMAEHQHQQQATAAKGNAGNDGKDDAAAFLATRKKRLRMSIG